MLIQTIASTTSSTVLAARMSLTSTPARVKFAAAPHWPSAGTTWTWRRAASPVGPRWSVWRSPSIRLVSSRESSHPPATAPIPRAQTRSPATPYCHRSTEDQIPLNRRHFYRIANSRRRRKVWPRFVPRMSFRIPWREVLCLFLRQFRRMWITLALSGSCRRMVDWVSGGRRWSRWMHRLMAHYRLSFPVERSWVNFSSRAGREFIVGWKEMTREWHQTE